MTKIFQRWKLLIGGLEKIKTEESTKGTPAAKKTISKAEEQITFLKNKNALVTMHFNSDVQERFQIDSKNYQKRISTIIGQVDREWTLYTHLNFFKSNIGQTFKNFLQRTIHKPCCHLSRDGIAKNMIYLSFRSYNFEIGGKEKE